MVKSERRNGGAGQNVTSGRSREPPAAKPTELPTDKAAPLQAVGIRKLVRHSQTFEDENDNEDENDSCSHALPAPSSFKHH